MAWESFRPSSIGACTIYHQAMENGWSPDAGLILNGNVRMNGRHPARRLLDKLSASAIELLQRAAGVAPSKPGHH
jgi:hypothetical protein